MYTLNALWKKTRCVATMFWVYKSCVVVVSFVVCLFVCCFFLYLILVLFFLVAWLVVWSVDIWVNDWMKSIKTSWNLVKQHWNFVWSSSIPSTHRASVSDIALLDLGQYICWFGVARVFCLYLKKSMLCCFGGVGGCFFLFCLLFVCLSFFLVGWREGVACQIEHGCLALRHVPFKGCHYMSFVLKVVKYACTNLKSN